jgi:hypothetical protein
MAHGVRDLGPALRLKVGEEFESAGVLGTVVQPAQRHHAVGVIAAAVRARGEVRGRDVLRLPPHDAGAADDLGTHAGGLAPMPSPVLRLARAALSPPRLLDMPLTVPFGMRDRFSVGYSRRARWWARRWRKQTLPDWNRGWDDREDPPPAGVREPATPPLLDHDGSVALRVPHPDEFR